MLKILTPLLAMAAFTGSLAAAEAAADAPKPKPYTLDTCIVSGDKLGTMGEAVVVVREGREIKFCCKGCIKDFDKEPAKFIAKIVAAEKAKTEVKTPTPAHAGHEGHQH